MDMRYISTHSTGCLWDHRIAGLFIIRDTLQNVGLRADTTVLTSSSQMEIYNLKIHYHRLLVLCVTLKPAHPHIGMIITKAGIFMLIISQNVQLIRFETTML